MWLIIEHRVPKFSERGVLKLQYFKFLLLTTANLVFFLQIKNQIS